MTKEAHYYLSVNAMTRPTCPPKHGRRRVQVREDEAPHMEGINHDDLAVIFRQL